MKDLTKVASQVPTIMREAATQLRKLASKNVELEKEAAAARHQVAVMKIARRMEQRQIEPSLSFEEKVAMLLDKPADKLAQFSEAIELSAGGFRLGQLAQVEEKSAAGGTATELDEFILGRGAYGES